MKKNLDFLIILFVCVLVSSALYVLYDNANDNSGNIAMTHRGGVNTRSNVRSSSANFAFPGDFFADDVVSSVGATGRRSRLRVSTSSSAPMFSREGASSYSIVSSTATSSSNGVRKITLGNGGNVNYSKGGSMIASSSQMVNYGGSMPDVSMPNNRRNSSPAIVNGEIVAVAQSYSPSMVNASNSYGVLNDSYRISMNGDFSSFYRDASSVLGTDAESYKANGQQRAPGGAVTNDWENWLGKHWDDEGNNWGKEENGTYYFDDIKDAWDAWCKRYGYDGYDGEWNEEMGNNPAWDDFLKWLQEGDGKYQLPIGDTLPLFFIALAYVVFVFVSKRKN